MTRAFIKLLRRHESLTRDEFLRYKISTEADEVGRRDGHIPKKKEEKKYLLSNVLTRKQEKRKLVRKKGSGNYLNNNCSVEKFLEPENFLIGILFEMEIFASIPFYFFWQASIVFRYRKKSKIAKVNDKLNEIIPF